MWWCGICGKSTIGSNRTGFWSYKQVIVLSRRRSSKRMRYLGPCAEICYNALKLLANEQEDGDGLMQNIVTNVGASCRTL